ncbi:MAG: alpha,2-fucosyltransferase [Ferruginibacter sp.]|nr:alpha,2-fucosyltransferase [Ferruginibacter sp.]
MVIVKLQGGLGNQMFQYAAAKALAMKNNCPLLLDVSFLEQTATQIADGFTNRYYELGIFTSIPQNFISNAERKQFTILSPKHQWLKRLGFAYPKIYEEPTFNFDENLNSQKPPVLLDGYWQSERYFLHESAGIKTAFTFPVLSGSDENNSILSSILNSCAVSVHVRRADYLHPAIAAHHGTCSIEYYLDAIEKLRTDLPGAIFYFFTDDVAWVSSTFTDHLPNSLLVGNNAGVDSWKDMYLMTKCRHHIIANSSFSWWGAWLGINPNKTVIAPVKWFNNNQRNANSLVPKAWIQM